MAALANEKDSLFWRTSGLVVKGLVVAATGKTRDAIRIIEQAITASVLLGQRCLSQFIRRIWRAGILKLIALKNARGCIGRAMGAVESTKESWWEAEVHRTSGEIALKSPKPEAAKAEAYFEHALAIARQQQAKSWEPRAAMSMARLWRDQGKRDEARELLAPVYGWFTEGFDTLDLKEAKNLLRELSS
jgi:hypothetical protein